MFVRLSRAKRLRAGCLLALVYMLCVLAPGISFAFSVGSRAAPCLTDENHGLGIMHVHEASVPVQHVHKDGRAHEHSSINAHLVQSDGNNNDVKSVAGGTTAPANDPHKASGTPCCGMVCLSALPTTVVDIVKPSAPMSVCDSENYRNVADNAPPRHYRPPIS
jgi:hypothetical protein